MKKSLLIPALCATILLSLNNCSSTHKSEISNGIDTTSLKNTLPKNGKMADDKPVGKG